MGERTRRRGSSRTAAVVAVLAAGVLSAAPAQAKTLKYRVTDLIYSAGGSINAGRATNNCVLGQSAVWSGNSAATVNYPDDPAPLEVGRGHLNLKNREGLIHVQDAPTGNDLYGQHQPATACDMGVPLYGLGTTYVNSFSSTLRFAQGRIKPAGGKALEIKWFFRQGPAEGGSWVPDFNHVEPFRFPAGGDCATIVTLKQMKRKRPTVPFQCSADASSFPNTDQYDASTTVGGGFRLARKKGN